MSLSTEERLKRRKLDALKRGVHRASQGESTSVTTHIVGIGRAGAGVVAETLRSLQPGGQRLTALVVDIGDHDLGDLKALAVTMDPEIASVDILSLATPSRLDLLSTLRDFPNYLTLEYPRYRPNPQYQPWLPPDFPIPAAGGSFKRAVAKAVYGRAFYAAGKPAAAALQAFAASVDAVPGHAMVAVVFGLSGGTGSGIAVDLARHLSNRSFGRRVLMAGVGIGPCDGDLAAHRGAALYPTLNELDTMGDEEKNRGVVMSCGEMFRNPFTAGFLMVPQQQAWLATRDLAATQARGNREIASLLTKQRGVQFWELLKLLNWVAAPSTQHSAARTPWGALWLHMLGFADVGDVSAGLKERLGVVSGYSPEFVEMRVAGQSDNGIANALEAALGPDVPPIVVEGAPVGSVQFIMPSLVKTHLAGFAGWRAAYEAEPAEDKLLDHSLLLEQGVLLTAPSTRIAGMAGASLWGGDAWVAVPLDELIGDLPPPAPALTLPKLQNIREGVA